METYSNFPHCFLNVRSSMHVHRTIWAILSENYWAKSVDEHLIRSGNDIKIKTFYESYEGRIWGEAVKIRGLNWLSLLQVILAYSWSKHSTKAHWTTTFQSAYQIYHNDNSHSFTFVVLLADNGNICLAHSSWKIQ